MRAAVAIGLAAGGILALAAGVAGFADASAHGKEVRIELQCSAADAATPLTQRCEARVTAANDGDPISNVRLALSARRAGKPGRVDGGLLKAGEAPGSYRGTIDLPAYGQWVLAAEVSEPVEGRVEVSQEILPPAVGVAGVAAARISLVRPFNARDVGNVIALVAHLLGSAGLFSALGAVLFAGIAAAGGPEASLRFRVARLFPPAAALSFVLIAGSGVYNAFYNAPTRSPGLLRPSDITGLPFGEAYVVAFVLKMTLAALMFAGTGLLALRLRRSSAWKPAAAGAGSPSGAALPGRADARLALRRDPCLALAAANLAIGLLLLANVVVIDYLHLISHAAALAPA